MSRLFTVAEVQDLLPDVLERADAVIALRADLAERVAAHADGAEQGLAEIKGLEARLSELLDWFVGNDIQVKGHAPLLLDFPTRIGGRDLLLCWLEGESELGWYHDPAHGFMGRRPLDELDG